jgi:hypothetical protein
MRLAVILAAVIVADSVMQFSPKIYSK